MTTSTAPRHSWPKALLKTVIRFVLRVLYRVEVHGLEHARAVQSHAVIPANHASFLDACARRVSARRADFCHRHVHRAQVVGAASVQR